MRDESDSNDPKPTPESEASDSNSPSPWEKGGPSPNPKGRPVQPKTAKEVRALARTHTTQMVEVLARVAKNPKAPFAARQAAASSLLDRAWGKPSGDFEGAEQLVIKILKMGELEPEPEMKTIEHTPDDDKGSE
jgi:hypothetical protein